MAGFFSVMLAVSAYTMWLLHDAAIKNGYEMSGIHSHHAEELLTNTLQSINLSSRNSLPRATSDLNDSTIKYGFDNVLQQAPYLRSISMLDADEKIILSTNSANVGKIIAIDNFLPATTGHTDILRIGTPWEGRDFADGRSSSANAPIKAGERSFIPLIRELMIENRPIAILFAVNPDFFINHISNNIEAQKGVVEIYRYDGVMLMGTGMTPSFGSIDEHILNHMKLSAVEVGLFQADSNAEIEELTTYHASRLYPFVAITHLHRSYALQKWKSELKIFLGIVIPGLLIISLLITLYFRNHYKMENQRFEAERIQRVNSTVFNSSAEAIIITDADANIISVNEAFICITGYSEADAIGNNPRLLASGKQNKAFYEAMWKVLLEQEMWRGELVNRRRDGTLYDASLTITAHHDDAGNLLHYIGFLSDITEHKQSENELRIAATAFETQDGIMITDADRRILRVNQAFTQITGYSLEEVAAKDPSLLKSGRQDEDFYSAMWASINQTDSWEGEIWNRRKNGEIYPEYLNITAVKDSLGNVTNYVGSLADITLRKTAEDEIKKLAFYDSLTGLPNRRLLFDRMQQALASSVRNNKMGALLYIDMNNFKALNDSLGHLVGDLLLQQVGQRLITCVREGDTVCRLGGDEFVVMLEDLSDQAEAAGTQAELVGEKIISSLNQSYLLESNYYLISPSIGVTLFGGQKDSVHELLKQADIAMYKAKESNNNALSFFDPYMQEAINIRVTQESRLRAALENREFQLYYQLQVEDAHQPIGAEVLIRWLSPELGMVSPGQFIPLAEETGLIVSIGYWVLDAACAQLSAWQSAPAMKDLVLSVNVSAKQFHQPDFVSQVRSLIHRYAITPPLLKLELTESILLGNIEVTISTMNALKEIGVMISLDDFGTGYSSLQYLKKLPLDQLKIDQSFVRDITVDESDRAIVRTIIAMADSLNLDVIAEGVETEEQRAFLRNIGCNRFQGYLFGRPVPVMQMETLMLGLQPSQSNMVLETQVGQSLYP